MHTVTLLQNFLFSSTSLAAVLYSFDLNFRTCVYNLPDSFCLVDDFRQAMLLISVQAKSFVYWGKGVQETLAKGVLQGVSR